MTLVELCFSTGARRQPDGWLRHATTGYAALTTLWTVYAATLSDVDSLALTMIFYALMLVLVFIMIGATEHSSVTRPPWYDWIFAASSAVVGSYFIASVDAIAQRITLMDPLSTWDVVFGCAVVVLTIEATRRTVGLGLTLIVIVFIVYNLFGDKLGGVLQHGEITLEHFLDLMVLTTDGVFGVPLRVAATYAFLFVTFGTFLARAGGSEFFFNVAAAISGRSPGGPAKIAVISSGLYGTISGSPTSDVVTTGSVTIPIMKRLGYSGTLAGGVEVAASTGGSLLPPVMGSAAFIMAEYTGIDYLDIVVAALLPAILYYACVYLQVHLRSLKLGLVGLDKDQIPKLLPTLRQGGLFIVPLAVIVIALLMGYTPTYVAVFGTIAVWAVSMFRKDTRLGFKAVYETLAEAALRMVSVTGACAAAGLVIGGITMTGLAGKFSQLVTGVADDSLFLCLLMGGGLTIVLGLGMPTPSAYVLAAVLVAPLLVDLGVELMAAHMFLLYFAVLSAMTPPVAVAAYAASAIADANPIGIAVTACKLSVAAFIFPFVFAYQPGILMVGSPQEIVVDTVCVVSGLTLIAFASEGFLRVKLAWWERLLLAVGGLGLLMVTVEGVIAGCILGAAGLARTVIGARAGRDLAASEGASGES